MVVHCLSFYSAKSKPVDFHADILGLQIRATSQKSFNFI